MGFFSPEADVSSNLRLDCSSLCIVALLVTKSKPFESSTISFCPVLLNEPLAGRKGLVADVDIQPHKTQQTIKNSGFFMRNHMSLLTAAQMLFERELCEDASCLSPSDSAQSVHVFCIYVCIEFFEPRSNRIIFDCNYSNVDRCDRITINKMSFDLRNSCRLRARIQCQDE